MTPDGWGFSLVPRDVNANPDPGSPSHWRASTNPGGSPGGDDPAVTIPPVFINEAVAHTELPHVDAIESGHDLASLERFASRLAALG